MRIFVVLWIGTGLWTATPLQTTEAQAVDGRPPGRPDAEVLVARFLEDFDSYPRIPGTHCPSEGQWYAEVFDALFALDLELSGQTDTMASGFAESWAKCEDPRFGPWYEKYLGMIADRDRDSVGPHDFYPSLPRYVRPFVEKGTPEAIAFLADIITDPSYSDATRVGVGSLLFRGMSLEEQENFFFRFYEDGRLPDRLADSQSGRLSRDRPQSFARRIAEVARRSPMTPRLHYVLGRTTSNLASRTGPPTPEEIDFYNALRDFQKHTDPRISPTMMILVRDMQEKLQERVGGRGGG